MTKYGYPGGRRAGTGIAPSRTHPHPLPRVHLPPTPGMVMVLHAVYGQRDMVVGLKSVAQLTLYVQISGFRGITEVYNLALTGNPDDHKCIPGTK